MSLRGIEDNYIKKMILEYLEKFEIGTRSDFEDMLMGKLSASLTDQQKKNKLRNILQSLKKSEDINLMPGTKNWYRVKNN